MKKITLIILFLGPIAVSLKAQTANTNSPDRVRQNERRGDAAISTNFQNGESPNLSAPHSLDRYPVFLS